MTLVPGDLGPIFDIIGYIKDMLFMSDVVLIWLMLIILFTLLIKTSLQSNKKENCEYWLLFSLMSISVRVQWWLGISMSHL